MGTSAEEAGRREVGREVGRGEEEGRVRVCIGTKREPSNMGVFYFEPFAYCEVFEHMVGPGTHIC